MKQLYYITKINLFAPNHKGVLNKVKSQCYAFEKHDYSCTIFHINKTNIESISRSGTVKTHKVLSSNKFIRYLQLLFFYKYIYTISKKEKIDTLYIRYQLSSFDLLHLLKKINTKKIIEIPTFPYKQEFRKKGIRKKLLYNYDQFLIKKTASLTDLFVVIGKPIKSFYGTKTININNGIAYKKVDFTQHIRGDRFNIVFVGNPLIHHGVKRFINSTFLKNRKIQLHIVGSSNEVKGLVNTIHNKNVKLYPFLDEENLDKLLLKMDFAISTLNAPLYHSSLKSRLYALYGLPFVQAGIDMDFIDANFVLYVENNNEVLDASQILDFYTKLNPKKSEISNFAKENLSWSNKIKLIIDALKD